MKFHIMDRKCVFVALVVQVAALVGVSTACSPPENWQVLPVTFRADAETVPYVILGNVTEKTEPRQVRRFGGVVYGAHVSVECVYKKQPERNIFEEVKIIGFGESNDCTNTEVEIGNRYIFLMAPYQSGFGVVEENVQVAAEPATEENIQAMNGQYGCEAPSDPTTPPPTTTPLITTRPPTTKPTTIAKASDQEVTGPHNGVSVTSLSAFAVLLVLVAPKIFTS